MLFVPWRHIENWKCNACGDCCRLYSVVLNFNEWLQIVKSCGIEHTASGLDKLYLKRRGDGSCDFLCRYPNGYACGLQYMKPKACQLWPFKISSRPEFGYAKEATYHYGSQILFVYADPMCSGLRYGPPTWEFASETLKEFVEIAIGLRDKQYKTTSKAGLPKHFPISWTHGLAGYL